MFSMRSLYISAFTCHGILIRALSWYQTHDAQPRICVCRPNSLGSLIVQAKILARAAQAVPFLLVNGQEDFHGSDDAAVPEPKRVRTEPSAQGSLGTEGNTAPLEGKPTLSQASYIRTFAKGVEQDIKKMAKAALSKTHCPGQQRRCSMTW
jgi:hypothetical protein